MWIAKFRFYTKEMLFGKIAKKYKVVLTGYPIYCYEKGNISYLNFIGTAKGENAKLAFNELKKNKNVIRLEEQNNFSNLYIKEPKKYAPFYSPYFIHLTPTIVDETGLYHFHIGSSDRKELEKLLSMLDKEYDFKLLSLKEEKISKISIMGTQPNLTNKQKAAYELATSKGYYDYPKKIDLKKLAKLSEVSYATFQQHLKYAEKKISRFFVTNPQQLSF